MKKEYYIDIIKILALLFVIFNHSYKKNFWYKKNIIVNIIIG